MRVLRWLTVLVMLAVGATAFYVGAGGLPTGAAATSEAADLRGAPDDRQPGHRRHGERALGDILRTGLRRPAGAHRRRVDQRRERQRDLEGAGRRRRPWATVSPLARSWPMPTPPTSRASSRPSRRILDSARISLEQAKATKDGAKADLRKQLASDQDSAEVASLNLQNAKATLADTTGAAARRGARIGVDPGDDPAQAGAAGRRRREGPACRRPAGRDQGADGRPVERDGPRVAGRGPPGPDRPRGARSARRWHRHRGVHRARVPGALRRRHRARRRRARGPGRRHRIRPALGEGGPVGHRDDLRAGRRRSGHGHGRVAVHHGIIGQRGDLPGDRDPRRPRCRRSAPG